jgi:tetratricopeptide (TPR) repeat protein
VQIDQFGLPITAVNAEAAGHFDNAINSYFRFLRDTMVHVDAAIDADPGMPLAQCLRGYLQLLATKREMAALAGDSIKATAAALEGAGGTDRERKYFSGLKLLNAGNILGAIQVWEDILVDHPHDGLALKLAHYFYFMTGEATSLRDSAARVMPVWAESDTLYGHVLGIYAFGLQETGDYRAGEAAAKKASEINPDDVYSIHSLTHVHEMEGRYAEGADWIESGAKQWAHCNNFRFHAWWHHCNFSIELGRFDACLENLDTNVRPDNESDDFRDTSSAASVLWRLEFEGVDVGNRWRELADIAEMRMDDHILAYADSFAMLELVADDRDDAAKRMLKALRGIKVDAEALESEIIVNVGLPICEAMIAYKQGDYGRVVELMMPIRYDIRKFGGSHVQRDVFVQTLLQSAVKSGQYNLALALLSERVALKPNSSVSWKLYADALEGAGAANAAEKARDKARLLLAA